VHERIASHSTRTRFRRDIGDADGKSCAARRDVQQEGTIVISMKASIAAAC
jgi:hypothetical protein